MYPEIRGAEEREVLPADPWRVVVLGALQGATTASQLSSDPAPCSFPAPEIDWIQRALNGWEQVSREFLRIDPTPLPWIDALGPEWQSRIFTSTPASPFTLLGEALAPKR